MKYLFSSPAPHLLVVSFPRTATRTHWKLFSLCSLAHAASRRSSLPWRVSKRRAPPCVHRAERSCLVYISCVGGVFASSALMSTGVSPIALPGVLGARGDLRGESGPAFASSARTASRTSFAPMGHASYWLLSAARMALFAVAMS